jgi:hypothetical protein
MESLRAAFAVNAVRTASALPDSESELYFGLKILG